MAAARRQDRHGRHADAGDADEADEPSPSEARLAAAVRALRHDAPRLQAFVDAAERDRPALALVVMRELGLARAHELGLSLPDIGVEGGALAEPLSRAIQEERPRGRPLDDDTRRRLLSRFPREVLERVRVHTHASQLTRALGAHAFTSGRDIFLGGGADNLAVLAHEVEHARQQQLAEEAPRAVGPAHGDAEAAASNVALWGNLSQRHFDASMVQRLVGFEAELTVPTYGTAKAAVDAKNKPLAGEVAQFLYGGVDYKEPMGASADMTLTADHDHDVCGPSNAIREKLVANGFIPPAPKDCQGSSILEYQCDAIDEMAPGSTTKYREQMERVVSHAGKIVGTAWKKIPRAGAYNTGVPEQQLRDWLGADYVLIDALVKQLSGAIKDRFSLQATVGIIPSGIVDLHRTQTPKTLDDAEETGSLLRMAATMVDLKVVSLMNSLQKEKKKFMEKMAKADDGISLEAFHGLLHLTQAYVIGNALNQTSAISGTPKNAVDFLAKMPLGDIHAKTLPKWLAEHQNDKEYLDIVNLVARVMSGGDSAKPEFWLSKSKGLVDMRSDTPGEGRKRFIYHDPKEFVVGMLSGKMDLKSASLTPLKPDPISSAATNSEQLQKSVRGQLGVPLEIRSAGVADSASLFARVMETVRQVRDINTKHMKESDRAQLLKDADT